MANFNKKSLGTASGSVGDNVFKTRYGRTYIASRPASYKTPNDPKSKGIRSKFRLNTKLSSALGKIFWIKYLWKESDIPGNTYMHKMFSINSERIDENLDFRNIYMVPSADGFNAEVISSELDKNILRVAVSPLGKESGVITNKKVSLQGVLYLTDTSDETEEPYMFIPFSTDDIINVPGEPLTFTYTFIGPDRVKLQNYNKRSFLVTLFTKDSNGEPKNVSVNLWIDA